MSHSTAIRSAFAALAVLAGVGFSSSAAQAATCSISFSVLKAGWVIGGSAGNGVLRCGRQSYPISIGGISAGFVFGASETRFSGRASFPRSPYDVAGVYGAAGAGAGLKSTFGATEISFSFATEKFGFSLYPNTIAVRLQVNADLSGLSISMR